MIEVGTRLWFPSKWDCGTLDSILAGANGEVIAYVIRTDDGELVTIDMQSVEVEP